MVRRLHSSLGMANRSVTTMVTLAALGLVAVSAAGRLIFKPRGAVAGASARAATGDDGLSTKLAFYIDCVNEIDPVVIESRDIYLSNLTEDRQLDTKKPPRLRVIGYKLEPCFKGLVEAAKVAPKLADVEAAAVTYKAALDKLEPLLAQADRYYQQNDFKDDAFAKGQVLHPQILAAYQAFFAARDPLHDSIDKYNKEILARSLARIEKQEGKSLRYYSRRVMNDGSALLDLAMDSATDPTKLRDAIEAYKTVYTEMLERANKNPAEVALIRNWSSFISDGDTLMLQLKEVQRSINTQLGDKSKPVEIKAESREAVLKGYNAMVEESNDLEFKSAE